MTTDNPDRYNHRGEMIGGHEFLPDASLKSREIPSDTPTPRTDACQGSDGTVAICEELCECSRQLEKELFEANRKISELEMENREFQWRDISTAPRDGERVLVVWLGQVQIASWACEVENWQEYPNGDFPDHKDEITFWMPLPRPKLKNEREV